MKIAHKLFRAFLTIVIMVGISGGITLYYLNEVIKNNALKEIKFTEKNFQNFLFHDTQTLSAALEIFINDQAFKYLYLKKDRDKLYDFGQSLFNRLKSKFNITHFYFILPDGTCFLRLHNKNIYNDIIKRSTFLKSKDKKNISAGIELGKTAFALRVVSPYYNKNELIGYIEFGEEFDHFLSFLKGNSNNELAIFVHKKFLSKNDWQNIRKLNGLRDNWEDLKNYVIINDTSRGQIVQAINFFTEENINLAAQGKTFFKQNQISDKTFAYGAFKIIDTNGIEAGNVLCIIDITKEATFAKKSNITIISIIIFLCIITMVITFFISRSFTNPIVKLKDAASEIGKGNLSLRVETYSEDEIGYLADSFNKMADNLQKIMISRDNLEEEVRKRTKSLEDARKEALVMMETISDEKSKTEKAYNELKKIQLQLIQSEKMSAIGTMTAGVAHELNNPMMGILNFIQYGIKHTLETDRKYLVLKDAEREIKRCILIVQNLLTFSHMEKEGAETRQKGNCAIILNRVFSSLQYRIEKEHVKIIQNYAENIPEIWMKINNIQQVFLNLVINALDALKDSEKKEISVDLKQEDDSIRIIISDTGCGIPSENMNKIFDAFFTTKPVGKGTGLGLSVCHNIIIAHKGKITFESKPGFGTKFEIFLPIDVRKKRRELDG